MEAAIFFYRGCVLKKTSFHFLPSKEVTRNCLLPDFAKEISPTEATRLYYFTFTIENSRSASAQCVTLRRGRISIPTLTSYCQSGNTSTEVKFRVRVRHRVSVGKETCQKGDMSEWRHVTHIATHCELVYLLFKKILRGKKEIWIFLKHFNNINLCGGPWHHIFSDGGLQLWTNMLHWGPWYEKIWESLV